MSSVEASSCEQNQQKKLAAFFVRSIPGYQSIGVHTHEGASEKQIGKITATEKHSRIKILSVL